mmetsp:Transcript_9747/g.11106  ORF Transcript_9747/g.11106 Transcript_9747/m.11106 type:complete len:377 (-) Transcript_9747:103-1233(-)
MNDTAPYAIYSPRDVAWDRNQNMPAKELQEKLVEFYMVMKPKAIENGQLEVYLKFARQKGVLTLQRKIKSAYGCSLDEADASEAGRHEYKIGLTEFYKEYAPNKPKSEIDKVFKYGLKKGYSAVDEQLQKNYGTTLVEFKARPLQQWKKNWKNVLSEHHCMNLKYELRRFYAVQNLVDPDNTKSEADIQRLVEWGMGTSRDAVNEQLLKNYQFCLDDVRKVKGNTDAEREVNLRKQLFQFYQRYDPERLAAIGSRTPDNKSVASEKTGSDKLGNERIGATLEKIYEQVANGIVYLESLNSDLKQQYGYDLVDLKKEKLRMALQEFYESVGKKDMAKNVEKVEKAVKFAFERGLEALNDELFLRYGIGINIDDFEDF